MNKRKISIDTYAKMTPVKNRDKIFYLDPKGFETIHYPVSTKFELCPKFEEFS